MFGLLRFQQLLSTGGGAFVAKQSFSNNNAAQSHHTCQSLPSDKIIPDSLFLSFMGATFWAILSISGCASLLREN